MQENSTGFWRQLKCSISLSSLNKSPEVLKAWRLSSVTPDTTREEWFKECRGMYKGQKKNHKWYLLEKRHRDISICHLPLTVPVFHETPPARRRARLKGTPQHLRQDTNCNGNKWTIFGWLSCRKASSLRQLPYNQIGVITHSPALPSGHSCLGSDARLCTLHPLQT